MNQKNSFQFTVKKSDILLSRELSTSYKVYLQTDVIPVRFLLKTDEVDILYFHGLSHAGLFFKSNAYDSSKLQIKCISLPWYTGAGKLSAQADFIKALCDGAIDLENTIILANTIDELQEAISYGFINSILCNNNCWLDWNLFHVDNKEKKFDLVVNARPERWKRVHLASEVKNLAIIQGKNYRENDFVDYRLMNPKYLNEERISVDEVFTIVAQAFSGGCFSEEEGACYSSSEYLLSGIPVVSTRSRGGRDIWYNPFNSVLLNEACADSVVGAVEDIKFMLENQIMVPHEIRENHINIQRKFRTAFISQVQFLLDNTAKVSVDFGNHFKSVYRHKMATFSKFNEI